MFGLFKELLIAADEQLTHLAVGIHIEENATLRLAVRMLYVPDGTLAAWSKPRATNHVVRQHTNAAAGLPPVSGVFMYRRYSIARMMGAGSVDLNSCDSR
jgi:hypothetical protein